MGVALPKTPEAAYGFRAFVLNLYSEALVGAGWDGRPFSKLVREWEWQDNWLTLRLTLRPNLKFHDGTPLDNHFVRKTLMETTFKSPMAVSYESVKDVQAVGADQVVIKLSRPEALLLADLSNSNISIPGRPDVGLGPYKLLERGTTTRLAAFDDYFRGKPKIDAIEIREYEEQRASWAALLRGQIDAVHEIVPNAVDFTRGQSDLRTFPFTRPYFIHLLFNVTHPILKDKRVRQALNYAVDRQAIIDQGLNKQGTIAEGPIWPFHWAHSTAPKSYTHNVEAATLRLDSAGLKVKPPSKPGEMPSRFKFKCLTVANHGTYERIAILLQKQLFEIGVDMEIEPVSLEQLQMRGSKGDFDAILAERTSGRSLGWTYVMFHSTKLGAPYKAADLVLNRLRSATADSDVRATVSDLQQIFHDDPPAIFIAWPTVARVVSSKFVVPEESGRDIISSIWQWAPAPAAK